MNKFATLGKSLNRNDMKSINGGIGSSGFADCRITGCSSGCGCYWSPLGYWGCFC